MLLQQYEHQLSDFYCFLQIIISLRRGQSQILISIYNFRLLKLLLTSSANFPANMPRTQNAPTSRNVIHSNLKTKQGKTLLAQSPRNADPHMQTRSKLRVRHPAPEIKEETVIVGQPPKKVKKNPKLETHFTIPNIQANQELLMLAKIRAHDMMDEVVRELHTVSKIKVTVILSHLATQIVQ